MALNGDIVRAPPSPGLPWAIDLARAGGADSGNDVVVNTRATANEAFRRRDWQAAYDGFAATATLDAEDYDAFAESAHWLGRPDEVIALYSEAYRLHLEGGAARRAALSAFMVAIYERLQGDGRRVRIAGHQGRELEVLGLVTTGKSNREIANQLCLSEKTVARHISNIFTKLGVSSRSAATAFAFANGLVDVPDST